MPVQPPRSFAVVEPGPGCSHGNLVRIFRLHFAIEIVQVIFSPVAAIFRPPFFPGVDPGIKTIEIGGERTGMIFVDKQRGVSPFVGRGPHSIPVGVPAFWKNKNHRPSLIGEIGRAPRRIRRKIGFVELVESRESVVRRLRLFIVRFVIHHRNMKVLFGGNGLDQGITAIKKGFTIPIPVDHEPGNSQRLGLINLLTNHNRIMRGIAHRNVPGMPKPRLIDCQNLWRSLSGSQRWRTPPQFLAQARMRARLRQREKHQRRDYPIATIMKSR